MLTFTDLSSVNVEVSTKLTNTSESRRYVKLSFSTKSLRINEIPAPESNKTLKLLLLILIGNKMRFIDGFN